MRSVIGLTELAHRRVRALSALSIGAELRPLVLRIASASMSPENRPPGLGRGDRIGSMVAMTDRIGAGARREVVAVVAVVAERDRPGRRRVPSGESARARQ